MKQLLSLFLFLLPCLAWAQYPSNGNQKITLGEQTTADGLIFRGVATDTVRKPSIDTMAYMVLDTTTNIIWHYKKQTSNAWLRLNLLPSDTASMLTNYWRSGVFSGTLPVTNGGTGQTTLAAAGINTGSGTINHLTKYSATGTTLANSNIRGIDGNLVITDLSYGLEAWNSNLSVIKLGLVASFFARKSGVGFYQGNNFYHPFDPAINYKPVRMFSNVVTGYYLQSFNTHTFYQEFNANPLAGDTITHVKSFEIDANGNVSIGNVTATEKLHVVGNARFTAVGAGAYANDLNITSTGVLTTASSDEKYKYNILPINYGLNTILQLNPVNFKWIKGEENDLGFIAQDVAEIIPEAVDTNWNSDLLMRYESIIPILTKAIQEQQVLIKALEQRLLILENK